MSTSGDDRSISIDRDVIGSTVITGNGNIVVLQAAGMVREDEPQEQSADAKIGPNPYKGLLAFHEEDADRFFGREEQIDRLWQLFRNLHNPPPHGQSPLRLLPVLGPSGSGKSSVARAGLIPELARRPLPDWNKARVAVLTPGSHPLESLAAVLARIATGDTAPVRKTREFVDELRIRSEDGQCDGLRRIAASLPEIALTPLILLVDQFEEVYSLCTDKDERKAFIDNILCAVRDLATHVSAIITLRTDFLDETQKHPHLNAAIAGQGAIIPAMDEDELRRAITEPARLAGRALDDATVDLLINETKGRDGALPLLQFALTRIWDGLIDGVEPTDTLKNIGGVGGALAGEAQRIYDNLPSIEKNIARRVFLGLVQLGEGTRDTRRRVIVASLVAVGEDPDQVEEVVRRFSAPGVRLITLAAESEGSETAEVTHEALFEHWRQLDEWLASSRDDLRFQRRLDQAARNWESQNRADGLLWRPPDLDLLCTFDERAGDDMTPAQLDFYLASKQAEEQQINYKKRQQRRMRRYLQIATTAAVVAAVLACFSFALFHKASIAEKSATKLAEENESLATEKAEQLEEANHNLGLALLERADKYSREGKPVHAYLVAGQAIGFDGYDGLTSNNSGLLRRHSKDKAYIKAQSLIARTLPLVRWPENEKIFDDERFLFSLRISEDGTWLATGSYEGHVNLRNRNTGKDYSLGQEVATSDRAHKGAVVSVAFSPDGRTLASASHDQTVRFWDVATREQKLPCLKYETEVLAVEFSVDGKTVATAGLDGIIRLYESKTLRLLDSLEGDKSEVWSVAFHPTNPNFLASASTDKSIRLWRLDTGEVKKFEGHSDYVWDVAFSHDGSYLASASFDRTVKLWNVAEAVKLWNVEEAKEIHSFTGHAARVSCVRFHRDDSKLFSSDWDGCIRVWDVVSKQCTAVFDGHGVRIDEIAPTRDGRSILAACRVGVVRRWRRDADMEHPMLLEGGHDEPVVGLAFSPDAKFLASASWDGYVGLWEVRSGQQLWRKEHNGRVQRVVFSPNGEIIVSGGWDGAVNFWTADTGSKTPVVDRHKEAILTDLAFSPDGMTVASASDDGTIKLWNSLSGECHKTLGKDEDLGKSLYVAFNSDGTLLVSTGLDAVIRLWNPQSGDLIDRLHGGVKSKYTYPIFGKRKHELITTSWDKTIRIWDVTTRLQNSVIQHDSGFLPGRALSEDGNVLITSGDDRTIRFWDLTAKREIMILEEPEGAYLYSVALSSDGKWLAYPGLNGSIQLVDLKPASPPKLDRSLFEFDGLDLKFKRPQ